MQDSTAPGGPRIPLPPDLEQVVERHDLVPEPTVVDVVEALAEALGRAVEVGDPARIAARCLTLTAPVRAAAGGQLTPDEMLTSLRRLTWGWRS